MEYIITVSENKADVFLKHLISYLLAKKKKQRKALK